MHKIMTLNYKRRDRLKCTKRFICVISDEEGLRAQRYAVSAGNDHEVREAMLRYLGADFSIKIVKSCG